MRRWVAVTWHATFSCVAAVLYFAFVLPRWWELMGVTSHTLGTVLRIVAGALIALAALPVVFTLLRTRRPEFRTPLLALRLRTASIALHVVAGVVIIGAAISEIWLSLDDAGQWLFGLYGAAAALALLGIFAFYLADIAELPPPPPKPLKPKKPQQRRKKDADEEQADASAEADAKAEEAEEAEEDTEPATEDQPDDKPAEVTAEEPESAADEDAEPTKTNGKSPDSGTSEKVTPTRRRRRRLRGGVAVDD
ncbi:hypothetical protein H7J93_27800 [Mycobacterium barrassiae]|uniref:hypothetical protein n=1 Tax=Mycobacterium barrassiae TaxID=319709 RepID=UPI002265B3CE|nr:hypothetical protein [Mycobacterium barrassiae]MCV7303428.1 hypothetical protein [Mycobacterium barrassiae]